MSLKIVKIHNHGQQESEYVELAVVEDCDLTYFIVADTTYSSDKKLVSNKLRHMHWFLAKDVKKGDLVFLCTGKGISSSKANASGTTTHVVFWGLDAPVWNDDGDAAMLFTLKTWTTKAAPGVSR